MKNMLEQYEAETRSKQRDHLQEQFLMKEKAFFMMDMVLGFLNIWENRTVKQTRH